MKPELATVPLLQGSQHGHEVMVASAMPSKGSKHARNGHKLNNPVYLALLLKLLGPGWMMLVIRTLGCFCELRVHFVGVRTKNALLFGV